MGGAEESLTKNGKRLGISDNGMWSCVEVLHEKQ